MLTRKPWPSWAPTRTSRLPRVFCPCFRLRAAPDAGLPVAHLRNLRGRDARWRAGLRPPPPRDALLLRLLLRLLRGVRAPRGGGRALRASGAHLARRAARRRVRGGAGRGSRGDPARAPHDGRGADPVPVPRHAAATEPEATRGAQLLPGGIRLRARLVAVHRTHPRHHPHGGGQPRDRASGRRAADDLLRRVGGAVPARRLEHRALLPGVRAHPASPSKAGDRFRVDAGGRRLPARDGSALELEQPVPVPDGRAGAAERALQ